MTCVALLIADGHHLEEIKAHLGHSTIRVTSDRNGHLFPAARDALAASLEDTFRRAGPRFRGQTRPMQIRGTSEKHQRPRTRPLTCDYSERTTGFEPATLTLAR